MASEGRAVAVRLESLQLSHVWCCLAAAWSTECFATTKKDGARTGRANRYCDVYQRVCPAVGRRGHQSGQPLCADSRPSLIVGFPPKAELGQANVRSRHT
jgi:hypothetical protein